MSKSGFEKNKLLFMGKEFETNTCGKCVVINYEGFDKVTVKFYDPEHVKVCTLSSLEGGWVYNPMKPLVVGKGYLGDGKYVSTETKVYHLWKGILTRAYDSDFHKKYKTYKDVEVCEEWLNFQNFAEWCYGQKFFDAKDDKGRSYHLDKDILVKGNRVYSPNTCCFVPAEINSLVVVNKRRRGDTPIGVYYVKRNRKYTTQCCFKGSGLKYLGSYSTPEEAFQVYKEAKKVSIKLVADQWKSKIEDKVYQSLLNWEIAFDD